MPDVIIDLLSSSPINSPTANSAVRITVEPSLPKLDSEDHFDLNSDDFRIAGLSDELDFPVTTRPCKKQKLQVAPEGEKTVSLPGAGEKASSLLSDDPDLPPLHDFTRKATTVVATTTYEWDGLVSDPIVFTSSAPERGKTGRRAKISAVIDLSDELPSDLFGDDLSFSLSQPAATSRGRTHLSERTANLLASISSTTTLDTSKNDGYKTAKVVRKSTLTKPASEKIAVPSTSAAVDEIFDSSPPLKQRSTDSAKLPKVTAAEKRLTPAERAAAKEAKDKAREADKELKRIAREQKAKEKQEAAERAEVNRSKTDKKVTAPEMILDLSRTFEGSSVGDQILAHMQTLGVETTYFDEEMNVLQESEKAVLPGNLVKWRRKVSARYNEDAGYWEPLPAPLIDDEKHVLVYLTATELVGIATAEGASGDARILAAEESLTEEIMTKRLDAYVSALRDKAGECRPICLVEGLVAWLRKNRNAKNRAYAAAVRSQVPVSDAAGPQMAGQTRRKGKASLSADFSSIDEDVTESLMLHLQIRHDVLVHHSTSPTMSAEWVRNFTEHISTIPYRQERMLMNDGGAAFCMDVGQVKTGDDAQDTYVKMLQEIQRVTPAMAYGIANRYGKVRSLVEAFRKDGALVLEEVKKSANRDGAVTNSSLGQAVSKRLYKVFMGTDPWSTNGIS